MRLTMMRAPSDRPELILLGDDGILRRASHLIRGAGAGCPVRVSHPDHVRLRDLFAADSVRENIAWLREHLADAPPLEEPESWVWAAPDTGGSIFCIGRNYTAHAAELGNRTPGKPMFFMKPRGCLAGNEATVTAAETERLDYEGELALVVGAELRGEIDDSEARAAVIALTLLNDITDRAEQNRAKGAGQPWLRAKGRIGYAPMGPWLLVMDDHSSLTGFRYATSLNGQLVQQGDPSLWIWNAEAMLRELSLSFGLEPGDIVSTGTPAGVGAMRSGDIVELSCGPIGTLRTTVS